jgi:hypothetical protein
MYLNQEDLGLGGWLLVICAAAFFVFAALIYLFPEQKALYENSECRLMIWRWIASDRSLVWRRRWLCHSHCLAAGTTPSLRQQLRQSAQCRPIVIDGKPKVLAGV